MDWKAGTPRPDTVICGRLFSTEVGKPSETSHSPDNIEVPLQSPDLVFMRSLTLLHQINLLEKILAIAII